MASTVSHYFVGSAFELSRRRILRSVPNQFFQGHSSTSGPDCGVFYVRKTVMGF